MPQTSSAEATGPRRLTDDEILIPEQEVKLLNGSRVVVRPWGLTQGKLVLERLNALQPALVEHADNLTPQVMLAAAYDEIVDLVALSVGEDRAAIEADVVDGGWTFEDLCSVTEAVMEVCILRSDGRGALPLIIELVAKFREIAARSLGPAYAKQRLSDSEKAGNSGTASAPVSGSRTTKTGKHRGGKKKASRKSSNS